MFCSLHYWSDHFFCKSFGVSLYCLSHCLFVFCSLVGEVIFVVFFSFYLIVYLFIINMGYSVFPCLL